MAIKIAVVGATGNVGREILSILSERGFPHECILALASARSEGQPLDYGEETLEVQNLETFNFENVDIALFCCGSEATKKYAPQATEQGTIVIDNSSLYRMDPDVPLIVPEVNPQDIAHYRERNIIANPNCSTIQMLVALKPLHDAACIRRIVVATYQSVSGAGRSHMDELFEQTTGVFINQPVAKQHFTKQIAFNCIPHIDVFMDDGATKEEWKMRVETQKILDPAVAVSATCVRVPVFIGHGEAVNVEFENPLDAHQACELLKSAPGVSVVDFQKDEGYVTPIECAGENNVFVSRIREDSSVQNGLSLWVVADNLRKGAALNAVQIAEILMKEYLS